MQSISTRVGEVADFHFQAIFVASYQQEMWLRQFYWLPANTQVKMPDDIRPIMPVTQADIPKILLWDWLWINDQKPKLVDRWNREMST